MKRALALLLALTLTSAESAWAAGADDKPNFSGTWTMDPARSQTPNGELAARAGRAGRGGGGGAAARGGGRAAALGLGAPEGPVTITQTESEITIAGQIYKLDGTPYAVGGRGGGRRGGGGNATAKWDGAKLVIETTANLNGNSIKSTQVRTLNADGKEMTVETNLSTARGDVKTKQVFTKNN